MRYDRIPVGIRTRRYSTWSNMFNVSMFKKFEKKKSINSKNYQLKIKFNTVKKMKGLIYNRNFRILINFKFVIF